MRNVERKLRQLEQEVLALQIHAALRRARAAAPEAFAATLLASLPGDRDGVWIDWDQLHPEELRQLAGPVPWDVLSVEQLRRLASGEPVASVVA